MQNDTNILRIIQKYSNMHGVPIKITKLVSTFDVTENAEK